MKRQAPVHRRHVGKKPLLAARSQALHAVLIVCLFVAWLAALADGLSTASVAQLKQLSDKGIAEAQYLFGTRLLQGRGIGQDSEAAFKCFKQSAAQKYAPAMTSLAEMYQDGIGCKENSKEAICLLEEAAALREARAEYKLGYLCMGEKSDEGLAQFERGVRLLKQASSDGSSDAAMVLGRSYWLGNCKQIGKDKTEALKWFVRADALGSKQASMFLAQAYYDGQAVPKDLRKALTYYSSRTMSAEGQRWHKLLTTSRSISRQQLEQARQWMLTASSRGHQSGIEDADSFNRR